MSKIRPIVKTHGGKFYLASWIIDHFPKEYQELNYCEPFCAGASVFLNKKPSKEEIINDIDQGIISIFKSIRDEPKEFMNRIKRTKYTERSFKMAQKKAEGKFEDYLNRAINEYILRRMSRGGLKKVFAWSDRKRGGKPGDVNAWETMVDHLPVIIERVKNSIILNKDFVEVFKSCDEEDTLFYLDPPYLHSTRAEGSTEMYEHEMTVEDHINLLNLAKNSRGKVIISGYSSSLYNRNLEGWKCNKKDIANNSSQSKTKQRRTEVIWMNY